MRIAYLLVSASCLIAGFSEQAMAQAASEKSSSSADLEEIVVTASRRSEAISKVPSAISAFSDTKLRDERIATLGDLTSRTPNIQISSFGDKANVSIRGIGNGNLSQAGGEPGVAVTSDGVYLGQSIFALTSFLDVNRVEVLRGPQGTLFGRNATGGAVNLIPNLPTADLSYGVDLTLGVDPTLMRTTAYLSGPLTSDGRLLGRVSVVQNYNKGFTRNTTTSSPFRLDGLKNNAVRGQLQWLPSDDFDVRLLVEHQVIDDSGTASFLLGNPAGVPFATPFGPAPIQGADAGNPNAREIPVTHGARNLASTMVNLTANWNLAAGSLKALVSYNETRQRTDFDGDGTAVEFTSSRFNDHVNQKYAELIYSSDPSSPFTYVIGANYYYEHLNQTVQVPHSQLTQLFGPSFLFTTYGTVNTESYAGFGHAQYALGSLKIFGGLRYTHDRKSVPNSFSSFVGALPSDSHSWNRLTYEGGLSYDLSAAVTGYAKYAKGYKSGGFVLGTAASAFNPETNDSFEAGLKGRFLGGALQANLSAFHMKYNDLQVNQILFITVGVTNAAKATVDGIELETVIRPTDRLRIEANGSWLHARFDKFLTADAARPAGPGCTVDPATSQCVFDLAGNSLPNSAKWSGSIAAYYDMPLGNGTLTPNVRYNWKSKIYFSEFNIPISSQGAVGKLDLALNYKSKDGRWTGSLFATNVTDKQVKDNVTVVSSGLASMALGKYQPGRQIGMSIGYHF
ncbi:TonB-dependent receptor [Flavisphingomonas formosensis]|uniref:TonB-dependent receptor n=1 Tax=Flavisphingomonas formosensis TaxID=861534 RepID=UPI0018DFB3E6|nr:TonB-dependent receptor [Sphingomonas formosensis]